MFVKKVNISAAIIVIFTIMIRFLIGETIEGVIEDLILSFLVSTAFVVVLFLIVKVAGTQKARDLGLQRISAPIYFLIWWLMLYTYFFFSGFLR